MKTVSLGDVVEVLNGYAFKSSAFTDVGPNVVRISNIQNGKVDLSKTAKVSLDTVEGKTRFELNENDLLVAMSGATTGKIGVLPPELSERAFLNQRVGKFRIRDDEKIDSNYLRYVISSKPYQDDIWSVASGVAQPNISTSQLMSFKIPLPPLPEQKRIAAILDQADALRRQRQRALDHLNQLGQSIFYEMFGGAKEELILLKDVVEEFRYGTSNKSSDSGYPALRIPNVIGNALSLREVKTVDVTFKELDRLRLIAGDLLFVRTNGNPDYVGRSAVFEPDEVAKEVFDATNWIYASYLIRARLNLNKIDPIFLNTYLSSTNGRRELRRKCKTSAGQYNINTQGLGSTRVPCPTLAEQKHFRKRMKKIRETEVTFKHSLSEAETLFASLQQRAFRGDL